tara:strand:- start:733 stop:2541 length:1809 start_codon:yes stop_codon:yes gene_type:complete
MTEGPSDVLSPQVDGAGTSTQVPSTSVGGITLSPEQFERLCGEVKNLFNDALPQSPIDCALPLSGTKKSGEEEKEHPEGATGSQKQEKVDLQTAMLSSGLGKEELIAMIQKLSSATLAETQVPPGDPTSRSSFNPSWVMGSGLQQTQLQRSERGQETPATPMNQENDDDDDGASEDECIQKGTQFADLDAGLVNGASPVIITLTNASNIENAMTATTARAFKNRLHTSTIEIKIDALNMAFKLGRLSARASPQERKTLIESMSAAVKSAHHKITKEKLDQMSCELAVKEGLAQIIGDVLRKLILELEKNKDKNARMVMAANVITQEMDLADIVIDVHDFVKSGIGGLASAIDAIVCILFGSTIKSLRSKIREHEAKMAKMADYPNINLIAMQEAQDALDEARNEANDLNKEVSVINMNDRLHDLVDGEPPIAYLRVKQIIEEFLKDEGNIGSYQRRALLVESQNRIEEAQRANENFMNEKSRTGGGGGRVLLTSEETQTSGDGEKEPLKEKPHDQRMSGKWKIIQKELIQPSGFCRRQLKMIVNRNLTAEDAIAECNAHWSEKGEKECKFCKSKGAIGEDIIRKARKILGKNEPGLPNAKNE